MYIVSKALFHACDASISVQTSELQEWAKNQPEKRLHGVIGVECSGSAKKVSALTAADETLLVSSGASSDALGSKALFPYFARTTLSDATTQQYMVDMLMTMDVAPYISIVFEQDAFLISVAQATASWCVCVCVCVCMRETV